DKLEVYLRDLQEKVGEFLKQLGASLNETARKLKNADDQTKQSLSDMLLQTLKHLEDVYETFLVLLQTEQIKSYLSDLLGSISSWISSYDGDKMQAKGIGAVHVLKTLQQIQGYLKQELPKLVGMCFASSISVSYLKVYIT
ncbi:hypothetical protein T265_15722, partial [Opisthorchis viverrini]